MDNIDDKSAVPRRKFRSTKRGKRKFHGNQFTDVSSSKSKRVLGSKIATIKTPSQRTTPRPTMVDEENDDRIIHSTPITKAEKRSVSARKIESSLSPIKNVGRTEEGTGFRFIDLDVLGNVFQLFSCPDFCEKGLNLYEVTARVVKSMKRMTENLLIIWYGMQTMYVMQTIEDLLLLWNRMGHKESLIVQRKSIP